MVLDIEFIALLLILGCVVGFFAGLLGIGGGGIMVPILTTLFAYKGYPDAHLVHLALGTSMAAIVITALSSLRAHHKKGAIIWPYATRMGITVLFGTFIATFIASLLNNVALAIFFSVYMALAAVQLFYGKNTQQSLGHALSTPLLSVAGFIVGSISALVSIGGGTMTVPFLAYKGVPIKNAIATSAAVGFPIALSGTLGYVINGWDNTQMTDYIFGFIYLPAVALISVGSVVFAPIGVNLVHRLPVPVIKKVFSLFLIALSLKMLHTIM